jgi:hypothetical protein
MYKDQYVWCCHVLHSFDTCSPLCP